MLPQRFCASMNPLTHSKLLLATCAALALCPAPLSAETSEGEALDETGAASTEANTRRTFVPEDFARFAPRSALDMARQIPGFSIREGGGDRGLGQADTNVIINGRRISGKSNGPVAALQRIPTEEVVQLVLVDGASLDIGGLTGQVLNVITASGGGISGQFRYAPQFRSFGTPARLYEGRVAIAGGGQKDEWTLELENNSGRRGDEGIERVFDGARTLIALRDEASNFNSDRIGLSGSYTRVADNENVLNLTGEVNGFIFRESEISLQDGIVGLPDSARDFRSQEDEYNFEIGADYQFDLGGGRLKLIAYHRYEDSPTVSQAITSFEDGSPVVGSRFTRDADEGETILRSEYSFGALGGDLLVAAEGVKNFLDITSALEVIDAGGDFQPVALPGATARVEEDRAEASLIYSRTLASTLQFQSSLGAEYSKISQSGPLGQTRTFYRPKGFVALDWKASPNINIAGRVERVVGQLNFFDFIASVDLNQERADVTNADLVPQQSWVFEIEAAINLGAIGTLNLRPFYEDISDIVDQIPIEGGGQAPGNLPSAESYGIAGDLTLLSEGFGWRGTRLDFRASVRDSSIVDPLLGTTRRLSGNDILDVGMDLRHDFQGTSWAIGTSASYEDNARNVRLDEIALRTESFPGFVSAFIENKDVAGLTIRANVANIADRDNRFDRTVFVDRRAGVIDFIEDRDREFGTIFTLEIEGSF
ncbi:TonB-dependent receptor [Erythrobacter sp. NAP1]|uniref:TonB-dependent receptor n=1 Tax=Erythrobacter sp. NAP1 TaxID=237727 RepID=UPI0002F9CD06|nr:TonB-dependent receptor [Erythrobacter sp. NAP1]